MNQKSKIRTGDSDFSINLYESTKNKILRDLNATEEDWNNPKWQLKNRIKTADEISKYTDLSQEEYDELNYLDFVEVEDS